MRNLTNESSLVNNNSVYINTLDNGEIGRAHV